MIYTCPFISTFISLSLSIQYHDLSSSSLDKITPQVGHEITELEFKLFCYSLFGHCVRFIKGASGKM
jgi:hypothetical protein